MGKTWLYVLRGFDKKVFYYYIGVTDRLRRRLYEHSVGRGSECTQTRKYTYLCALYEIKNVERTREYYENLLVKQLMYLAQNNWNYIRGGSWCGNSIKKPLDIDKLDKFPVCKCGFPKWNNECPKQQVGWYTKTIGEEHIKCLDMCANKHHHFKPFSINCDFCDQYNPREEVWPYILCQSCCDIYTSSDNFEELFAGKGIEKYNGKYSKKCKLFCNHETKYFIDVFNYCICICCLFGILKKCVKASVFFGDTYDDFLEYIWDEKDFFLEKTEELEKYPTLYELKEVYRWYLYNLEKQVKDCKPRPRFLSKYS